MGIDIKELDKSVFLPFAQELVAVTLRCRPDMHEPDEQNVSARVTGLDLDNAMGNDPMTNYQELTVGITTVNSIGTAITRWFNLASLIALARLGAMDIIMDKEQ